jgi:hypothetical protein
VGTERGEHRVGHLSAIQRTSRTTTGTPLHLRMDGPGWDGMDVAGGGDRAKLQFSIFVPTADQFATMRRSQSAQDLVRQHRVDPRKNGIESFIAATRRQNFLVPPRAHRAFPLLELT